MLKILIVDDDVAVTNFLMVFLMQTGRFDVAVVNDSREVPGLLDREAFAVILLDMDMPNLSGLDILQGLRARGLATPAIVLTGVSDVELAVRAMKLGAFDYLTKPVDEDGLLQTIDAALEHSALHRSLQELPSQLKREDLVHESAFKNFPTRAPAMIRLLHSIERIAESDLTVFIQGERGTGKEMLARAIHQASPRRDRAFVAVDTAALDPAAFPAAFFGQARLWGGTVDERPGFLEEAGDGTLYLGEVELLQPSMQVRIKRLLQDREFYRESSTRILAAGARFLLSSSLDPDDEGAQGRLSRDLLYHLQVNSVRIPPLRERLEDLPLLAEHFLHQVAAKIGRRFAGFAPEVLPFLARYDFPDNVQELRNIVEAAAVNAAGDLITIECLSPHTKRRIALPDRREARAFSPRPLAEVAREHAARTLEWCGGDRERAARELAVAPAELEALLGAAQPKAAERGDPGTVAGRLTD